MAISCGNCKNQHESSAQVKECYQKNPTSPRASSSGRSFSPNPNAERTVTCRKLLCRNTKTGPVSELIGWACCPEHEKNPSTSSSQIVFAAGEKVLYNGKRFDILELVDSMNVRLRTGGQGKVVPLNEIAKLETALA